MNWGRHRPLPKRGWALLLALAVVFAAHAVLLYRFLHTTLPAAVISGALVLMVIKHAGLLGALGGLWRRRKARNGRSSS